MISTLEPQRRQSSRTLATARGDVPGDATVELLRILGNENRLRILQALAALGCECAPAGMGRLKMVLPVGFEMREIYRVAAARDLLAPRFAARAGTLAWYCLDHWTRDLELDLKSLKREHREHIRFLPGAREFLAAVRRRVDPDGLLASDLSNRLGLTPA